MALSEFSLRRQRSRLHFAVLGLVVCAISYMIIWDGEEAFTEGGVEGGLRQQRRLAFLDGTDVIGKVGYYQSSPSFTSLAKPSKIKTSVQRQAPPYDPADRTDSTCDDILLYMPHTIAGTDGHGAQLNAYILASMMATYANKAMVLLEHPHEGHAFKGSSQFGCPKDARQHKSKDQWSLNRAFPTGLSRLQRHPDWLSNKCPLPCQGTFKFDDWDTIRKSRKNSIYYPRVYTPQEVQCSNGNGRHTKVLVIGGEEARDYFEGHFREKMLQRPSTRAFGWAMRMGATQKEASAFVKLTEEGAIWDFMSALMARSGIIRFQPWIARDVEDWIRAGNLTLNEYYDSIHVRRGDMLTQGNDHEATGHVKAYWKDRGFRHPGDEGSSDPNAPTAPANYIPFAHYLIQYDDLECNDKPRTVYVATDDPWEVKKEIEELQKEEDDGVVSTGNGCHKFKFVLNHYMDSEAPAFHLHDGPQQGRCIERYHRNIASIADMMVAAKSDTFIGEMNSNWSRLVRIFRMELKEKADDDGIESHHVERKMKVAWGNDVPLPPGL